MSSQKKFKNDVTIDQLAVACRHVDEMLAVGVTENMAIRTLELFSDVYGKIKSGGSPTPHHVDQVERWSVKAKHIKNAIPDAKPGAYFRVEHGTPRRAFARMVLDLYRQGRLTKRTADNLVRKYWKLAVVTIAEDRQLNKIARSEPYSTPEERWAAAGIEFD